MDASYLLAPGCCGARRPALCEPFRIRLEADHTREAIAARLAAGYRHSYLRDLVLGAIDGCVTTFAVVWAWPGPACATSVILVLGMANLLADGFSMAISNFQGIRAEQQVRERARRTEERHLDEVPEGEREEIRQIFARKGVAGDDLEQIVRIVTLRPASLGRHDAGTGARSVPLEGPSAWRAGLATYGAFVIVGLVPPARLPVRPDSGFCTTHPFAWF